MIGLLFAQRNVAFFLISSMVLGLGLLELEHLIYPRLPIVLGMLAFFTNLLVMEFQVRYLALFLLFLVIDGFKWFWMGSLHKNIQLMLEFLSGPFLVLHFSYYTLIIFLMMLSVILLSKLLIVLSILSAIRHLISGNNQKWLLNLNLIYKTLRTGAVIGLLISMQEKLYQFCLAGLIVGVIEVRMDGLEKSSLKMLSSLLNWIGPLTLSLLLKLPPRKLDP